MSRSFVSLGEIAGRASVDCGGLRIHSESKIAFDTCYWGAHFVTGSRDKFITLFFFLEFLGNVAQIDDFGIADFSSWRNDERNRDDFVRHIYDDTVFARFGILISIECDGDGICGLIHRVALFVDKMNDR